MQGKLLICIAFHYVEERYVYLKQILQRFLNTYKIPVHIILDTNRIETRLLVTPDFLADLESGRLEIQVHTDLPHPHCLTWCHRFYMKEHLDDYDYFMYTEDDMDLPWENFENWLHNFNLMWPSAFPGFIRVESKDGELYCSDQHYTHGIPIIHLTTVGSKQFTQLNPPYSAMWVLPQYALITHLTDNFARFQTEGYIREDAASYSIWEIKMPSLIELTSEFSISPLAFIYHLPNNYVNAEGTPLGKTKVKDVLRVL